MNYAVDDPSDPPPSYTEQEHAVELSPVHTHDNDPEAGGESGAGCKCACGPGCKCGVTNRDKVTMEKNITVVHGMFSCPLPAC